MKVLDVIALAKKHSIKKDTAAPDFFEGALPGNGDLGVVACTHPDGIDPNGNVYTDPIIEISMKSNETIQLKKA
ncbi:MAG: hypothetical protein IJC46_02175 [Clostridia bacterium]|nr:hypothetical protein [Clostridia bacterium]